MCLIELVRKQGKNLFVNSFRNILISLGNEESGRATESDLCLAASVKNPSDGQVNHLWQEQQSLALKAAELELPGVLPALENNKEQETLNQQLQMKGQELNEFWKKHNIDLMSEGRSQDGFCSGPGFPNVLVSQPLASPSRHVSKQT
uniref:Uncharacterized protein n=1 Tax=Gopherus agassizii TaxID=38772 RepID=A0A452HL42_9SAUR